jgi:methylenetetrahydrofolate dehydrogenase (NADP+)/methenyltetrahydrofolate cyclohydrolase
MSEAEIIDGKALSSTLRERVAVAVSEIKAKGGFVPNLTVVLAGDNPASQVYVRNKGRQTEEVGMKSTTHRLPAEVPEADLLSLIQGLNENRSCNGILVQLPLPDHIDEHKVLKAIDPNKDVDGFHLINVGQLWTGTDSLVPCTPYGCITMLKHTLGDLSGQSAVVVGRSNIVGKPMAALLIREHCTVTIAHSRTRDLPARCREADILIAAVGRPEMIRGDWVKPGATVIDVGINRIEASELGVKEDGTPKTRIVGDVAFAEAKTVAGAITPVPGGVGPMTIACLLRNTVIAASRQNALDIVCP